MNKTILGTMRIYNLLFVAQLLILVMPLHSKGQTFDWVRTFESGSNLITGLAADVTVDADAFVYTTGSFAGTVDFDPGTGSQIISSMGQTDVFITKHNSSGNLIWVQTFGGPGRDDGASIALGHDGNLYISGTFRDSIVFGSAGIFYSLGFMDLFVLKIDTAGVLNWVKHAGGAFGEEINGMAVDSNNVVYTTGFFEDIIDFDPSSGTAILTSAGHYDIFLWKLDSAGNYMDALQFGDDKKQVGESIVISKNNDVVITGHFYGATDFDPGSGTNLITSAGQNDIFILSLDGSNNFNWLQTFGSNLAEEIGYDITRDPSGNILVTGCFYGTIDFDAGPGAAILTTTGSERAFILKLDSAGGFIWARDLGGIGSTEGHGIATDDDGNVYTTGNYFGNDDFDPGPGTVMFPPTGSGDCFISKLDSNGIFVYAGAIAGPASQWGRSIAIGPDESIYTAGFTSDTVDFDPGPATYQFISSGLNAVGFVHKMVQSPTAIQEYYSNNDIELFPNPVTDFVNIQTATGNSVESIYITNVLGETIMKKDKFNSTILDVKNLSPGYYFLHLKTVTGFFVEGFVKK
ncbi:MAG: SBBP repeat-containing protein [Bacteroidetes bacterium]|nr:SBBP repeat-containing protein [Bacteroidota bacterium]